MSRESYGHFHRKNKDQNINDIITLEETDPGNRYQTISYTRFNVKNFNDTYTYIQISPVKSIYWNLNSASEWFERNTRDPETNLPILSYHTFIARIRQQLRLKELYEDGYSPEDSQIKDLFLRYIKDIKDISEKELILLHNFFHIDNTILMKWNEDVSDHSKHRQLANDLISKSENGSWIVRNTSVKESDVVKARVITYKSMDGTIKHIVIAHIYGYGYVLPQNMSSGQEMPSLGSGNYMIVKKDRAHPSFISLIKYLNEETDCDFVLEKLIY